MNTVHPDENAALLDDVPMTMQAAHITSYGQPLTLDELPCPQVSSLEDGHVLLRVHAVAVQPADIKTRLGKVKAIKGKPTMDNPVTLGYDCSGTIVAVGPGVAALFAPGDEVAGVATGGALAPFTAVHESMLCKKPSGVSFAHAAACVTSGLSALQALQYAKDECINLEKMLVTAGGGGCGHVAIQMAKEVFGVSTVAATGSGGKKDFIKACGADIIIDYNDPTDAGDFTKTLQGYDFALDLTGETKKCLSVIAPGGCVIPLCSKGGGPTVPDGEMLAAVVEAYHMPAVPGCVLSCLNCCACCRDKRVHNMVMLPVGSDLEQVLKHVDSGVIKATVDRVYPFAEAPAAFDYVEQGHVTGRVIVEILPGAASECAQVNPL